MRLVFRAPFSVCFVHNTTAHSPCVDDCQEKVCFLRLSCFIGCLVHRALFVLLVGHSPVKPTTTFLHHPTTTFLVQILKPDQTRKISRPRPPPHPIVHNPTFLRNAPDVFKAEPSSKPMMPSKPTTPARGGSGKPGATSSEKVKPTSHKKGAAAAAAAASKAKAKVKVKSPAVKKKPAKPAPPPPPPPPPPPYRFEYEGWSVVGGRELVAVGMFLYASAPIMK